MAGLRLHSPMLHPVHYCSQRRVRAQSDWLSFLRKTLSYSDSSRFIPALSLTPATLSSLSREEAPPRIRQSRRCHGREQSFAHSGLPSRACAYSLLRLP